MTITKEVEGMTDTSGPPEILEAIDAPAWGPDAEQSATQHDPAGVANLPNRFRIDDTGQADWAMRKLARVAEQQSEVDELAARQIEPIERWRRNEQAKLDRERLFWEALLLEYHRAVLGADSSAKSIRLPHGQLKSRQGQPQWHFVDDEFISWANARGLDALVRVKFEVDKVNAKEALIVDPDGLVATSDGEIVPGVSVTPGERSFTVEPEVER